MIYGYCRVSTGKQSIERQIRNIQKNYPDAIIIKEVFTGTSSKRPEWSKLLKQIQPNDTIVFDSVSRMSRNSEDGFKTYEILYNHGINLIFLKEPYINTSTYKNAVNNQISMTDTYVDYILEGINKYLLALAKEQIRLAFIQSEKEIQDIRQRTKEGLITARLNGKQIGQVKGKKLTTKKSITSKKLIKQYSKEFDGSLSDNEVMKLISISRNSYYKYKREIKGELDNDKN